MAAPHEAGIAHNLPVHRTTTEKSVNASAKKARKRVKNHSMKKMRRAL